MSYCFTCILDGNDQQNYWSCKMHDYLEGFIVKFYLNFWNAQCIKANVNIYNDNNYQG